MKDLFSSHSENYSRYRPSYPIELYQYLKEITGSHKNAWDCGTGNGQVAGELAEIFEQVYATDISVPQLAQAVQKPNIQYTKQAAEKTNFLKDQFDLVTVAQAIHWFDFDAFYREVRRVLKPSAPIAVFGYSLLKSNAKPNKIIEHFYKEIVGSYWDVERRYLDEAYKTIPFPFEEVEVPVFEIRQKWSCERLLGYLNTWSAVEHFKKEHNENPVDLIAGELKDAFGEVGDVAFPIIMRVGKNKNRS